jgi:hypothetical protein
MPMPKLRPYQAEPLRAILDSVRNKRGLNFSVMMSRQAGKNELSAQLEVLLLTLNWASGGNIIKASPTFKPQTINSMQRLKERLDQAGYSGHHHTSFGYQVWFGKAAILFYSAEPSANVVGATAHLLIEIDESQDVDPEKFNKDFKPMGATTNATTVHYGTAWTDDCLLEQNRQLNIELERRDGIRRHFEYDWQQVARYNDKYRQYVEAERERLGADHPLFTSQYELKPLAGSGRLFSPAQLDQLHGDHPRQTAPSPGRIYVAGLDLAGEAEQMQDSILRAASPRKDSTILTIAELTPAKPPNTEHGLRIVNILWRTGVPHPTLYEQILHLIRDVWRCQAIVVDATGVGAGIASFLARALPRRVHPLQFTAPAKSALGFQLVSAVTTGRLQMYQADADDAEAAEFWREMKYARTTLRANQTMNFYVDPADGHDDFVISAALTVEAARLYQPRIATGQ